jgi:hypothetical protein
VDFRRRARTPSAVRGGTRLGDTARPPSARAAPRGGDRVETTSRRGWGDRGVGQRALRPARLPERGDHVPGRRPDKAGRGVPDVAAGGRTRDRVTSSGRGQVEPVVGGTSAVSPLWAWPHRVGQTDDATGPTGRLTAPAALRHAGRAARHRHGDNGGYSAAPGWDPCTGLWRAVRRSPQWAARSGLIRALGTGSPPIEVGQRQRGTRFETGARASHTRVDGRPRPRRKKERAGAAKPRSDLQASSSPNRPQGGPPPPKQGVGSVVSSKPPVLDQGVGRASHSSSVQPLLGSGITASGPCGRSGTPAPPQPPRPPCAASATCLLRGGLDLRRGRLPSRGAGSSARGRAGFGRSRARFPVDRADRPPRRARVGRPAIASPGRCAVSLSSQQTEEKTKLMDTR